MTAPSGTFTRKTQRRRRPRRAAPRAAAPAPPPARLTPPRPDAGGPRGDRVLREDQRQRHRHDHRRARRPAGPARRRASPSSAPRCTRATRPRTADAGQEDALAARADRREVGRRVAEDRVVARGEGRVRDDAGVARVAVHGERAVRGEVEARGATYELQPACEGPRRPCAEVAWRAPTRPSSDRAWSAQPGEPRASNAAAAASSASRAAPHFLRRRCARPRLSSDRAASNRRPSRS